MAHDDATSRRRKRTPRPLDKGRLEELALAYVARFATSAGKLEAYLRRKLRERGWDGEDEAPVADLVARFVEKNYVDDEVYGRAKAQGLLSRGYGARRVEEALRAAAIGEDLRGTLAPGESERREAAVALARRRSFGPYGAPLPRDAEAARKLREKRLAAMLRAGHDFDAARRVLEAATVEELETWVAESQNGE
ncbi:RecX family transcriptional regulator [Qipengyuania sp. 6B39]|uniref:regulatory protein RecX n=1 Tax=Qipengyuania proteolytica TaxID=2867239 RepID=UPI001C895C10|nr:RecX family transcriptional regulator [Qipengyuania proteolytica]MBX7497048.1 RecX family transcriptional regulator [Qipengyuania proteolytica]